MALMLTKRSSVFLKQQQTVPVPPDGFVETNKPVLVVPQFSRVSTNRMSGVMNSLDQVVDTCRSAASFNIDVNLRATGTSNLSAVPEYAELMKISGFKVAANPLTETFELVNDTDNIPRGSAAIYVDNKKFSFTNTLVGALTANFNVGEIANLSVAVTGYIDDVKAKDENNPTVTLSSENVLVVSCADIYAEGGTAMACESIVIKTNPQIQNTYTMGGTAGIKQDTITDYSLTADVTFPVDGTKYADAAALIENGIKKTIKIIIGADSAGKPIDGESIVVLADTSRTISYTDEDRGGILYRTVTYKLDDHSVTPAIRWITGKTSGL